MRRRGDNGCEDNVNEDEANEKDDNAGTIQLIFICSYQQLHASPARWSEMSSSVHVLPTAYDMTD